MADNKQEKNISALGEATGFSSLRRGITSPARHLDRSLGNAMVWIKNLFLGKEKVELPSQATDPRERFQDAMEFYGQNELGLQNLRTALRNQFFAWAFAAVGAVVWSFYIFSNLNVMGYWPVLPCFGVIALTFTKVISTAFYHWQVRTRRLGSIREFLRDRGGWLPFGGSRNFVSVAVFALIGAALFYVDPALAQATPSGASNTVDPTDIFKTPERGDLFFELLEFMLGGNPNLGPLTGLTDAAAESPYKGPIAYAFGAFNWALMMFGTMLVSWHTIGGMVSTAKEGEILGRKYHQIWAPVRVTVGMGFLAPVSGGFCAAQVLVIYLIVAGGNMANVVWNGWLDYFDPQATVSNSAQPDGGHLADLGKWHVRAQGMVIVRDIARKELCYQTIKQLNEISASQSSAMSTQSSTVWEDAWNWIRSPFSEDSTSVIPTAAGLKLKAKSMWDNGGASPDDLMLNDVPVANSATTYEFDYGPVCGSVTFDFESYGENIDVGDGLVSVGGGEGFEEIARIKIDGGRKVIAAFDRVREEVIRTWARSTAHDYFRSRKLYEEAGVDAATYAFQESAPGQAPDMPEYLELAIDELAKELGDVPRQMFDQIRGVVGKDMAAGFISSAREKGWAMAGAYYNVMAKLQAVTAEALDFLPEVNEIDFDYINDSPTLKSALVEEEVNGQQRPGVLTIFDKNYATASTEDSYDMMSGLTMQNHDDILSKGFLWGMKGLIEKVGKLDARRPLEEMIDLGHSTLEVGYWALGSWSVLKSLSSGESAAKGVVGGTLSKFNLITGLVKGVVGPLLYIGQFLLIGLFIMAVVHAYLLPMIPYFFFTMFIVGMLTLTVEALIAAPLWALMHMRMDGDDFVDQVQRPGYMIAFNLILRPSLAVLGLFLSFVAFGASTWLFNETYSIAAITAVTGKEIELIGMFMMLAIAFYIHWQLALHSFELITQVPDRVTRWFGQGGENLAESQQANSAIAFFARNTENKLSGIGAAAKMKGQPNKNESGKVHPGDRHSGDRSKAASELFSKPSNRG